MGQSFRVVELLGVLTDKIGVYSINKTNIIGTCKLEHINEASYHAHDSISKQRVGQTQF